MAEKPPPTDQAYMPPPPPYSQIPNQGMPEPQQPYQAYPPPAGAYVTAPVGQGTTVTVVHTLRMAPSPISLQCPHCSAQIVTEVTYVPGTLAWILCIVFLLFGLWCGCCLIPFCVPECQDVEHRCPNCKTYIGTYRRL